ncbi:protoporphyrinogen oxidase [Haloarculaceae archaeon H-GB2-1]|nr:protoporphyrinogen oxidase [Haloarculaceae archaeon H-GB1-1]MEA5408363.1 protoporphyrinogen oxidase [Haloarculaceae archaeon H-GB2-1]
MRVGIVGAGLSGLTLGYRLRNAGVETVTFEAAGEPGGVIRSRHDADGRILERGPQRTRLTPAVSDVVSSLGLEGELIEAADPPLYVYRDGELRRAPLSIRSALTTSLFSWRGKLRALGEPLAEPPRDDETVAEFFSRSFGPEVAENFLGPLYAGLYGSKPDEMPVQHSAAKAMTKSGPTDSVLLNVLRAKLRGKEPPAIGSFRDGLQTLPNALYEEQAESVHLDEPVRAIREAEDGYRLESTDRDVRVDRVVLTTPAEATASLLAGVAPEAARRIGQLTFNRLAVVHLHSEGDLHGSGFQVPHDEPLATLGTTWNASLLDRDGVYTSYLGGSKNPDLLNWADDRIAETACREFEAVTGCAATPLGVSRLEPGMPAYDHSWDALDGLELPDGIDLCTNYVARAGIPGRVRAATTLADELQQATDDAESVVAEPPSG